jgi:radical SAM protein with 4Fe4S-binding SPASM domain
MKNVEKVNYLQAPLFVWWDVTNKCNFNCIHCYSRSGIQRSSSDELTFNEAKKLISEFAELGVFYIYFLGGEPFIRPDFIDIIALARKYEIGVMINTNGWFINKSISSILKQLGVHNIRVSIDGACSETHDSFRNMRGAFTQAVAALKYLIEARIPHVSVVSTITRYNINEADQIIDLAANLGVADVQCVPLSISGRGADNFDKIGLTIEQNLQLSEIIKEKHKQYLGKTNVYSVDGIFDKPCTHCVQRGEIKPDFMGCRASRTACNIDYNGNVLPCLLVREPIAGNIRQQSFKEIWDHSSVFELWRRKRLDYPECQECEWNNICIRECPISKSQHEITGDERMKRVRNFQRTVKLKKSCQIGACHLMVEP